MHTTATATAFHRQVQALAPAATAETMGNDSWQFGKLSTPDGRELAKAGAASPAAVLADLRQQLAAQASLHHQPKA